MHAANGKFWIWCNSQWPGSFSGCRVLELGSQLVGEGGGLRNIFDFEACEEWVGVDWRPGRGVDVVSLAHELDIPGKFDTVISASMIEHDPHWDRSITRMVDYMEPQGALFLSWGAATNPKHETQTAPDYDPETNPNAFHPRPAGQVINLLETLGLTIQIFKYECYLVGLIPGIVPRDCKGGGKSRGRGEVVLVAYKNPSLIRKDVRWIDDLFEEDLDEDPDPFSRRKSDAERAAKIE